MKPDDRDYIPGRDYPWRGQVKAKPWWESKVVWLNAITFVVLVLSASDVLALIPPEGGRYVAATLAVLNIALRLWFTDSNLTAGKAHEEPHG